mgnify:CR=1 FL=1
MTSLTFLACMMGEPAIMENCFVSTTPVWFDSDDQCVSYLVNETIIFANENGYSIVDFNCTEWPSDI